MTGTLCLRPVKSQTYKVNMYIICNEIDKNHNAKTNNLSIYLRRLCSDSYNNDYGKHL